MSVLSENLSWQRGEVSMVLTRISAAIVAFEMVLAILGSARGYT